MKRLAMLVIPGVLLTGSMARASEQSPGNHSTAWAEIAMGGTATVGRHVGLGGDFELGFGLKLTPLAPVILGLTFDMKQDSELFGSSAAGAVQLERPCQFSLSPFAGYVFERGPMMLSITGGLSAMQWYSQASCDSTDKNKTLDHEGTALIIPVTGTIAWSPFTGLALGLRGKIELVPFPGNAPHFAAGTIGLVLQSGTKS